MATFLETLAKGRADYNVSHPGYEDWNSRINAVGGATAAYNLVAHPPQPPNIKLISAYGDAAVQRATQQYQQQLAQYQQVAPIIQEGLQKGWYTPGSNRDPGLSGMVGNVVDNGTQALTMAGLAYGGALAAGAGGGAAGAGEGAAGAGSAGYIMPGANAAASGATGGLLADGAASTYEGASLVGAGATGTGAGIGAGGGAAAAAVPSTAGAGATGLSQYLLPGAIVGSSLLGYKASTDAAKMQSDAANNAAKAATDQYNTTRNDLAPYRAVGTTALGKLAAGNITTDPGYEFRQSEGEKAINRAAAARGGWDSGAALKSLTRYNQDYASEEYGKAWNRLAALAGIGQTATTQTAGFGAGATNQSNDYLTSGAAARGAGAVGGANAITGGVAGGINLYNQNRLYDMLFQKALTT